MNLRAHAIAHTLFSQTTLERAIDRLGFVQADPIRAPATAQDLILRHRVRGYRAGDLEREYACLSIEEDYLHAYGFLPRDSARLLHPRAPKRTSALESKVLAAVADLGEAHPSAIAERVGHARVVNAWGGLSKATTHALAMLRHRGRLRVVRRDRGTRVYALTTPPLHVDPKQRLDALVMVIGNVLAPVLESTLRSNITRFKRLGDPRAAIERLIDRGLLERARVDGALYLWPRISRAPSEPPRVVRFLAPFDPLVWCRKRFEHLFGWSYRFEAYTPRAKRVRGYYALPMLFADRVIGWANATNVSVDVGFVRSRPRDPTFRRELDAEIARMIAFLRPRTSSRDRQAPAVYADDSAPRRSAL